MEPAEAKGWKVMGRWLDDDMSTLLGVGALFAVICVGFGFLLGRVL